MNPWPDLPFWQSQDWVTLQQKLDNVDGSITPKRNLLFNNLRRVKLGSVRVVILGQDPYPDPNYATGSAFSIPSLFVQGEFPRSLQYIFNEYARDLHFPIPNHGCLAKWEDQGVLLINAIASLEGGKSLSHDWREYHNLTRGIVEAVSKNGAVFALLGARAQEFRQYIGADNPNAPCICTSHPSSRSHTRTKTPFTGSRLFSTINDKLISIGLSPIDWRLDDLPTAGTGVVPSPGNTVFRKGNRILENTEGYDLGDVHHT